MRITVPNNCLGKLLNGRLLQHIRLPSGNINTEASWHNIQSEGRGNSIVSIFLLMLSSMIRSLVPVFMLAFLSRLILPSGKRCSRLWRIRYSLWPLSYFWR